MAEVLAELVAKITADASELKRALAESEKDVQDTGKAIDKETKSWQDNFKAVGKASLVMGAAITAAMTGILMSFTKTGSELSDLALKTGVSVEALAGLKYAAEQNGASLGTVEMAIRRVAMAMSDATSETSASAKAFQAIGLSLTDLQGLNPEQQFLKIATAIAEVPDPMKRSAAAVNLFGRSGTDMLPMLSQGADGLQKMMKEGQKLTDWTTEGAQAADAFGDAMSTLKTAASGLTNTIGAAIAPALKDLAEFITDIVVKFRDWAKEHPELTKQLGLMAITIGVLATAFGTILLLVPGIVAGIAAIGIALHLALPVVGLVALAITGLIAAGVLLAANWGKVTNFLVEAWSEIKIAFLTGAEKILGVLEGLSSFLHLYTADIKEARNNISNMIDAEKIAQDAREVLNTMNQIAQSAATTESNITQLTQEEIDARNKAQLDYFDRQMNRLKRQSDYATEDHDKAINLINQEYGESLDYNKSKVTLARESRDAVVSALDDEGRKAQQIHNDNISNLNDEYNTKISLLDAATAATIKSLNDQIDAIDSQSEADNRAKQDADRATKLSGLIQNTVIRGTEADWKALSDFQAETSQINLGRQRADNKDALRSKIDMVQEAADNQRKQWQIELDANVAHQDELLAAETGRLANAKKIEDLALTENLTRIETARLAFVTAETDKINAVLARIATEKQEWAGTYISGELPVTPSMPIASYASGGTVSGAIGQPQLAMVHGGETIIPANESGGIVVNFTQPVFFDREDTMNRFVDKIRKGIQRQDRIRFGGAYNGT